MAKTSGNTFATSEPVDGGTVKVRLVKGLRGTRAVHRLSVKALGLNKLNDVRELKDSPQVRGLINTVHYLVRVES